MNKKVVLIAGILLCVTAVANAQFEDIWEQETLTNGFWELNDSLAANGIEVGFGLTNIYQLNLNGGTDTAKDATVFALCAQWTL